MVRGPWLTNVARLVYLINVLWWGVLWIWTVIVSISDNLPAAQSVSYCTSFDWTSQHCIVSSLYRPYLAERFQECFQCVGQYEKIQIFFMLWLSTSLSIHSVDESFSLDFKLLHRKKSDLSLRNCWISIRIRWCLRWNSILLSHAVPISNLVFSDQSCLCLILVLVILRTDLTRHWVPRVEQSLPSAT